MSKPTETVPMVRDESRRIAWLALALFVGGLVLPVVAFPVLVHVVAVSHQVAIRSSAGLGLACEALALVLGVAGWRHLPGKVAGLGSGALLGLILLGLASWFFR